jgi:hypothetical protein
MAEEFYEPGAHYYHTNIELLGINLDPANKEFGLYKPNTTKFVRSIEPYTYNNELNTKHIQSMVTNIQKNKLVIGGFITIEFNDGMICLFDGHHRIEALKKLDDSVLDEIVIYVFHFKSDARESQQTRDLFSKINTVKPFDVKEQERCVNSSIIIELLKKKHPGFKQCLRDNKKLVQKGNYLQSTFVDELKDKLKQFDTNNKQYDNNLIADQIMKYNDSLPAKGLNYIFNTANIQAGETEEYKKMALKQFYLASPGGRKWSCFVF